MDSLIASLIADQDGLTQKIRELSSQCDRISSQIEKYEDTPNSAIVTQLESLLIGQSRDSVHTSSSIGSIHRPIEIREVRFLNNEEYLVTLVNHARTVYKNLAVCTRKNLELGFVDKLRGAQETKVLITIPMATFMREKYLGIYIACGRVPVSAEFPYYVCEIAEPDLTTTSISFKVRKNIKCPIQAHICFDIDDNEEFFCELKLSEPVQAKEFERAKLPRALTAQVKQGAASLSNLLKF